MLAFRMHFYHLNQWGSSLLKHLKFNSKPPILLRRTALICAVLVFIIIGISAFIRLSGNGLGCSPWPVCYGEILQATPQSIHNAAQLQASLPILTARIGHRILAVVLLPIILILIILGYTHRPKCTDARLLPAIALLLVLFLAVLGRWTSGRHIPIITLGNLIAGFLLFGLCWRLFISNLNQAIKKPLSKSIRLWQLLTIVLLLALIVFGGLVSSSYAGLNCHNLADCFLPTSLELQSLNPLQIPTLNKSLIIIPTHPHGITANTIHLWLSLVTAVFLVIFSLNLFCNKRPIASLFLLIFLSSEIMLGLLLERNNLPLSLVITHNLLAAALLATLVAID